MKDAYITRDGAESSPTLMEVNLTSARLLVSHYQLSNLLCMLSSIQCIDGYGTTEQAKPVTFDVKVAKTFVTQPVTEREKELQKESEERNDRWFKAYQENEKLKKELAALKAQPTPGGAA